MSDIEAPFGGLLARCETVRDATHVGIPRGAAPRFAVPLDARSERTALRFLLPSNRRIRLTLRRAAMVLTGRRPNWLSPTELLDKVAAEAGRDGRRCTIAAGTPGPHGKPSALFLDDTGAPVSIAKVAVTEASRALVSNEAGWLERLSQSGLLRGRVPNSLSATEVRSAFVLVETLGYGPMVSRRPMSAVHGFLSDLQQAMPPGRGFIASAMHQAIQRRLGWLRSTSLQPWIDRAQGALALLEERLGDIELPMVVAHRDFVPWNMRGNGDTLFVYDWEYASAGYVPLYDAFHYRLTPLALRRTLTSDDARSTINTVSSDFPRAAGDSNKGLAASTQLLSYLLDLCLTYLESHPDGGDAGRVVDRYGALIDLLDEWASR